MKYLLEWIERNAHGDFGVAVWLIAFLCVPSIIGTLCAVPLLLILWGAGIL